MSVQITEIEEYIEMLILTYGSSEEYKKNSDPRNANFFTFGFLDSFTVTTVVALVEEKFSFNFSFEDLNSDHIRSVKGMAKLIFKIVN